ncbi:hypothetical protein D8666_23515 [Ochrobactrum soli]|nr:hypothetical protein D8666_23515 [[Ochrobactrum] soli]
MTDLTKPYHSSRQFAAGVRLCDLLSQVIAEALKDGLRVRFSNNNADTFSELLARLDAAEKKYRE